MSTTIQLFFVFFACHNIFARILKSLNSVNDKEQREKLHERQAKHEQLYL